VPPVRQADRLHPPLDSPRWERGVPPVRQADRLHLSLELPRRERASAWGEEHPLLAHGEAQETDLLGRGDAAVEAGLAGEPSQLEDVRLDTRRHPDLALQRFAIEARQHSHTQTEGAG